MENLYCINSFERNYNHGLRLKQNLIDLGIEPNNIIIILGYDLKNNPQFKKNTICFYNFKDFILPKMLESGRNCYYLEDHTIIYDNPEKYDKNNKMVWLGFMKRLKDYIVGAHLVYFDKDLIKEMNDEIDLYRPCYIDRLFRNIGEKKGYLQIENSITKIVEHYSLALGKIRKNPYNKYFKIK
tara:strand:+ start:6959 stop:7507 length:549 start_codon:yes stop_codon:yes gene_type:complete